MTPSQFFSLALRNREGAISFLKTADPKEADDLVNFRSRNGNTLLHIVAEEGDATFAKLLIDHGARIYSKNSQGKTVIEIALLCANIDQDELICFLLASCQTMKYVVHNGLYEFPIAYGHHAITRRLIGFVEHEYVTRTDEPDWWCRLCGMMTRCLSYGNPIILRDLIHAHHRILEHHPKRDRCTYKTLTSGSYYFPDPTPLLDILRHDGMKVNVDTSYKIRGVDPISQKLECLKVLLEDGMDPFSFVQTSKLFGIQRKTLVHLSVAYVPEESFIIVKTLLDHAHHHQCYLLVEDYGRQLLQLAIAHKRFLTMKHLIVLGVDPVKRGDIMGDFNDFGLAQIEREASYLLTADEREPFLDFLDFLMIHFGVSKVREKLRSHLSEPVKHRVETFVKRVSLFDLVQNRVRHSK